MNLSATAGLLAAAVWLVSCFMLWIVCKAAALNEEHPNSPDKIEGEHHV